MEVIGTTLIMRRGDTEGLDVEKLINDVATPFELGDSVLFTVKRHTSTDSFFIQKTITSFEDDGTAVINLDPDDTKDMKFGDYPYDIQFNLEDGTIKTLVVGILTLLEEVS